MYNLHTPYRKLLDNFSHESDVTSLQDPFTSRPYKTPSYFYYCATVPTWGVGAVDSDSVNSFLAAALTSVMRGTVPIPALASASVLHSVAVGGSVVGVV